MMDLTTRNGMRKYMIEESEQLLILTQGVFLEFVGKMKDLTKEQKQNVIGEVINACNMLQGTFIQRYNNVFMDLEELDDQEKRNDK